MAFDDGGFTVPANALRGLDSSSSPLGVTIRRAVAESFGYQEYEAPLLESLDLYAAKSGEELVKEQSYVFKDRGGDEITLRPELTLSLARMVATKQNELTFPVRWWSFGPFWRYERPQKGRTREFFQWNIDLLGVDKVEADAEIVAVGAKFLESVGLSSEKVKIYVSQGIGEGIISFPRGLGHTAYDKYLADKGVNFNELIGPVEDPASGLDVAWGIRASLTKV